MRKILIIIGVVVLLYLAGPHATYVDPGTPLPEVPRQPDELEAYISQKESNHNLKPENEARIVWYDSAKGKTPFSIVYLHGFSASQKEGDPIHRNIAKAFGCNLYLGRLPEHGIDTTDTFINFTAGKLWAYGKEALSIGKAIGDNVIIMSTSTGGTLAINLAANFPEDVSALINMSPNIEINNPSIFIINNPWGLYIARIINGDPSVEFKTDSIAIKYWTNKYRLESLAQLQEFIEKTMTRKTFNKVIAPSLTLYYYKNEEEQDPQVKVSAMLRMHHELGTPDSLKSAIAMPNTGAHVIGSSIKSKDVEGVYNQIERFIEEKLKLEKVK